MRNRILQQREDNRARHEQALETFNRFQLEAQLSNARRRVAGRKRPEPKAQEPAAPETPMETETTKEVSQDAGLDGSGARQETTHTVSRPQEQAGDEGNVAPEQPFPKRHPRQGTGQENELATDYLKAIPQGAATAFAETEQFILRAARDGFGMVERDAVQLDRPEMRPESVFVQAKQAMAFSRPDAMGPKLVASFAQILVPYVGIANRLKAAGMAGSLGKDVARNLTADVITSLVAIDPHGERLATMLNGVPALEAWVPDYLASNDEDAPAYEGMIKNMLEVGLVGGALEAAMAGLRLMRAGHKASQTTPTEPDDAATAAVAREQAVDEAVEGGKAADQALAGALSEAQVAKAEGAVGKPDAPEAMTKEEAQAEAAERMADQGLIPGEDTELYEQYVEEALSGRQAGVDAATLEIQAMDAAVARMGEVLPADDEKLYTRLLNEERAARGIEAPQGKAEPEPAKTMEEVQAELAANRARHAHAKAEAAAEAEKAQAKMTPEQKKDAQKRAAGGKTEAELTMGGMGDPTKAAEVAERMAVQATGDAAVALRQANQAAVERAAAITRDVVARAERVSVPTMGDRMREARAASMGEAGTTVTKAAPVQVADPAAVAREKMIFGLAKSVQRRLAAVADVVPPRTKGRSMGHVGAQRLGAQRLAQLRQAVARYDAAVVEGLTPPAGRAEEMAETTLRMDEAAEGVDDVAFQEMAERHRRVAERLWRGQPIEGSMAMAPDTHAVAKTDADAAAVVVGMDGRPMGMDRQQVTLDLARNERDAMTIAPYAMRPEHMRGVQVETADVPGLQVAPEWGQAVEDFAEVPGLVASARGVAYTAADHAEAAQSLEALKAHMGSAFEVRQVPDAVKANAADYLHVATALANDTKRTSGRALIGTQDMASTWEAEMALTRQGAFLRHVFGDAVGAKKAIESHGRKAYYALGPDERAKAALRNTEKAGAQIRSRASALRSDEATFESAARAVVEMTEEYSPRGLLSMGKTHRIFQAMIQLRASGLLSGLTTHAKNVMGNTASMVAKVPVSYLSALHRNGATADGFKAASGEVTALWEGYWEGMKQMRQMFHRARIHAGYATAAVRQQQKDELDGTLVGEMLKAFVRQEKWDVHKGQAKTQAVFGQMALSGGRTGILAEAVHAAEDLNAGFGRVVRATSGIISAAVDAPLAMLQAEDMVMKTVAFKGELRRLASIRVQEEMAMQGFDPGSSYASQFKNGKWTSAAARKEFLSNEMYQIMEGSFRRESQDHDLFEQAIRYAEEATFTQKLDPINQAVLNTMNTRAYGAARLAVPFYTVLMNMGRTTLNYMPGVPAVAKRMSPRLRAEFEELSRVQQSDAAARQLLGATAFGGVVALYTSGHLTGGAPSKGQFRRAHGQLRQPYSIKIGNSWVGDYRELWPGVGAIIGLAADATEMVMAATDDDEVGLADAAAMTVLYATKNLMSQTAIAGMGEMIEDVTKLVASDEAGEFPERLSKMTIRRMQSTAASLLPYSAFTRRLADAVDGGTKRRLQAAGVDVDGNALAWHVQVAEGFMKEAKRRFLWMSDELPDVRGWDGEILTRSTPGSQTGLGAGVAAFLNPLSMTAVNSRDPGIRAMLDNETGPDWTDRTFHLRAAGMSVSTPLLPSEYGWLSERRGKLIRQRLDGLVQQPWFKAAGPGIRQRNALKAVFGAAERQAEAELRAIFPNVDVRLHKNLLRELDRERAKVRAAA